MKSGKSRYRCVRDVRNVPPLSRRVYTRYPAIASLPSIPQNSPAHMLRHHRRRPGWATPTSPASLSLLSLFLIQRQERTVSLPFRQVRSTRVHGRSCFSSAFCVGKGKRHRKSCPLTLFTYHPELAPMALDDLLRDI